MYFKDESKSPEEPNDSTQRGEESPHQVEYPGDTGSGGDNYTEPEIYTDPEGIPAPPTSAGYEGRVGFPNATNL